MDYVPWPGFGPFESYEADHTVAGGETLELAGLTFDVLFTPGHSPGHVTYAVRGRGRAVLRRRPVPGVGRARRPARRRLADAAGLDRVAARRVSGPRRRSIPGTWGSRRSAASAPRTRSCASSRAMSARARERDPGAARARSTSFPSDAARRAAARGARAARSSAPPATAGSRRPRSRRPSCSRAASARRPTSSRRRCTRSTTAAGAR